MGPMAGIRAQRARSLSQERPKAGRAAAPARGVKMRRTPLLSAAQVAHACQRLAQGERPVHRAPLRNVGRCTRAGAYA
jgi:DNA invertase Pin-like site-specific DNA recombinase